MKSSASPSIVVVIWDSFHANSSSPLLHSSIPRVHCALPNADIRTWSRGGMLCRASSHIIPWGPPSSPHLIGHLWGLTFATFDQWEDLYPVHPRDWFILFIMVICLTLPHFASYLYQLSPLFGAVGRASLLPVILSLGIIIIYDILVSPLYLPLSPLGSRWD